MKKGELMAFHLNVHVSPAEGQIPDGIRATESKRYRKPVGH
jgi:hypothetical protein